VQVSILSVEIGTGGRDPGYDMDIVWMLELPLPPWTFLLVVASCNYSFLLFDTAFAKSFTANFLQKVTLLRGSYRRGSGVSGALVFLVEDLQTPPPIPWFSARDASQVCGCAALESVKRFVHR
jgi:hypothetical protein